MRSQGHKQHNMEEQNGDPVDSAMAAASIYYNVILPISKERRVILAAQARLKPVRVMPAATKEVTSLPPR